MPPSKRRAASKLGGRPPKNKTSETAEQQVSVAGRSQDSCDKHAFQSTCFAFRCKQAALDLMRANSPSDHEDDLQCQHEEPPGNSNATNSSTIAHAVLRVVSLRRYPPTGSTTAASTPLDVATSGSSDAPSSSTALPPSGALIYLRQLKARSRHANRKPLNRFALQAARLLMPPPTDADTVHDWQQRIEDQLSRTWQLLDRGSGSTTMPDSMTRLTGKTHRIERYRRNPRHISSIHFTPHRTTGEA